MIKAIIFDMDGVLVDSEPMHMNAWNMVAKEYDFQFTNETWPNFVGGGLPNIVDHIIKNGKGTEDLTIERGYEKKAEANKTTIKNLKEREGAYDFVKRLKGKYILGIASGSFRDQVKKMLEATGGKGLFDFLITGDKIKNQKPDPEIYLKAVEKAGCKPEECIAIEDSGKGITSAKASGMKCIAIPNDFTKNNDFSAADLVVNNFSEINIEKI